MTIYTEEEEKQLLKEIRLFENIDKGLKEHRRKLRDLKRRQRGDDMDYPPEKTYE